MALVSPRRTLTLEKQLLSSHTENVSGVSGVVSASIHGSSVIGVQNNTRKKLEDSCLGTDSDCCMDYHTSQNGPTTRSKILQWLCPQRVYTSLTSPAEGQDSQDAHENAGKRFVESTKFQEWLSGNEKRLWGTGPPGAGKTFLVSRVQAELGKRTMFQYDASNAKIAVLYMHYNDPRPAKMLLACMLRQFIKSQHQIPSSVEKAWSDNTEKETPLEPQELVSLMQGLVEDNNKLYLVVDAWDECHAEARGPFLKELMSLGDQISVFITSRFTSDTDRSLSDFHRVKISANADDIRDYVSHCIAQNSRLQDFAQVDKSLEDDIKHKLIEESGRQKSGVIFLLVRLHMESLQDEVLLEDVRKKLQTFQYDLNDKYRDIIERIGNQTPSRQTIAINTLTWVTHARRPLLAKELQHALAVSPEDQQFKPGRMPRVDDIIAFSCGMVVFEPSSDTFRLVHNTARTFMEELTRNDTRFNDPHCAISLVLGTYLCLPALEQPDDPDQGISYATDLRDDPCRYDEQDAYEIQSQGYNRPSNQHYPERFSFDTKMRMFPLARYAAMNLGHHLRAIQDLGSSSTRDALKSIHALLSERPKRKFYERLLDVTDCYPPRASEHRYSRWGRSLEGIAYYDDDMSDSDLSDKSEESSRSTASTEPAREVTSLHLAAQIGIPELITGLLSNQSLLQVRDYDGFNPLGIALCCGHSDIVLSFLKAGSNLDLRSSEGCRLLLFAAQSDRRAEEVLRHILEHSLIIPENGGNVVLRHFTWLLILVMTKVRYYSSKILTLCQRRSVCWTRFRPPLNLESLYPDRELPNTPSEKKVHFSPSVDEAEAMSPILSQARIARTYSEAIFPLETQQQRDYIKLVSAALQNDCDKIRLLINDGKVVLKPRRGHSSRKSHALLINLALFLAIENDKVDVVKMLIEGGVPIESRDFDYRTPLHRAVARSNVTLVKFLMDRGAEVDAKDCREETPWAIAVKNLDERMCRLLVNSGADVNTRGLEGMSLLYGAAAGGNVRVVKLLLKQGVDPSVTTDYGWSSLHWAAGNGKLECVRLLLEAGADLNPLSDTQKSPLDMAIEREQTVIADILRRKGAETSDEIFARRGGHHYSFFDQAEDEDESDFEEESEESGSDLEMSEEGIEDDEL
ncbi:hypothetical protein FDECE_11071 [Fusarium decemcellulare]|nr:hypothetical protein FDECE_11071 [Fusarium decemcellulare]